LFDQQGKQQRKKAHMPMITLVEPGAHHAGAWGTQAAVLTP
jgi:hypothetical protein